MEDALLLCGLGIVIIVIIWIALAVWVHKDARERGLDATTWTILVALFGPFGLGFYLGTRLAGKRQVRRPSAYDQQFRTNRSYASTYPCSNCGWEIPRGAQRCPKCGKTVVASRRPKKK